MDGCMILARHNMDDLPLGLFATAVEAESWAAAVTDAELLRLYRHLEKCFNIWPSSDPSVWLVQFVEGVPDVGHTPDVVVGLGHRIWGVLQSQEHVERARRLAAADQIAARLRDEGKLHD